MKRVVMNDARHGKAAGSGGLLVRLWRAIIHPSHIISFFYYIMYPRLVNPRSWLAIWIYFYVYPRPRKPAILELLNAYSMCHPGTCFVQVGSNDGVSDDPIRYFILRDNWHGILVEPVRYLFDKLVSNYNREGLVFENVAIGDRCGVKPFYRLRRSDDALPSWYEQVGSLSKEQVLVHKRVIPDIEKYLLCEEVPCLTFEALVKKHGMEEVDVVHIDAEGYDYEIIKLMDIPSLKPAIILFESQHLSEKDAHECASRLQGFGYRLFREQGDTIAFMAQRFPRVYIRRAFGE